MWATFIVLALIAAIFGSKQLAGVLATIGGIVAVGTFAIVLIGLML